MYGNRVTQEFGETVMVAKNAWTLSLRDSSVVFGVHRSVMRDRVSGQKMRFVGKNRRILVSQF